MFEYSLTVGDWSKDGHNQTDEYLVLTSHNKDEVCEAYKNFVRQHKIALNESYWHGVKTSNIEMLCNDYENNKITIETIERLEKAGIPMEKLPFSEQIDELEGLNMSPDDIVILLMEMVKTQIEGFTYEIKEPLDLGIKSIGYGCYSNVLH